MNNLSQYPVSKTQKKFDCINVQKIPLRKISVRTLSLCDQKPILLLVTNEQLVIVDLNYEKIILKIKKIASIKSASLSKCGRYILCHYSTNNLKLLNSTSGKQITQFIGLPPNSRNFYLSQNSNKLIGGNNQMICLWRVSDSQIYIMTKQWKNINCYAINKDGQYFALGTFNGQIYILRQLQNNQCAQVQFKGHKKCIMQMIWNKNQLISVDYDNTLITFQYNKKNDINQKMSVYKIYKLDFSPKQIISTLGKFYLLKNDGIYWFIDGELNGIGQGNWQIGGYKGINSVIGKIQGGDLEIMQIKQY